VQKRVAVIFNDVKIGLQMKVLKIMEKDALYR
jgi:hypothetical protein